MKDSVIIIKNKNKKNKDKIKKKHLLCRINSRLNRVEEQISELEDKFEEFTQTQHRKNKEKHENEFEIAGRLQISNISLTKTTN